MVGLRVYCLDTYAHRQYSRIFIVNGGSVSLISLTCFQHGLLLAVVNDHSCNPPIACILTLLALCF